MALHRDIYWIGRQWAVTGFGVQAVDQRLKGAFDIEAARLWDEQLSERVRTQAWVNTADFDKALTVARSRFPQPPQKPLPLVDSVLELLQSAPPPSPQPVRPAIETDLPLNDAAVAEAATPSAPSSLPLPVLQTQGALARFLPQWRIRK